MNFWTSSGTMFFMPYAAEDARSDIERRVEWDAAIAWCTETFGAPASQGRRPDDPYGWAFFGFHPRDPYGNEEPLLSGIYFEHGHEAAAFAQRFSGHGANDIRTSLALRCGIIEQLSKISAQTLTSVAWGRIASAIEIELKRTRSLPRASDRTSA